MAKKKPKRRVIVPTWIVRNPKGDYRAFVCTKPPELSQFYDQWFTTQPNGIAHYGLTLCTKDYESSTLTKHHLKPGGGPLKVRLVGA